MQCLVGLHFKHIMDHIPLINAFDTQHNKKVCTASICVCTIYTSHRRLPRNGSLRWQHTFLAREVGGRHPRREEGQEQWLGAGKVILSGESMSVWYFHQNELRKSGVSNSKGQTDGERYTMPFHPHLLSVSDIWRVSFSATTVMAYLYGRVS